MGRSSHTYIPYAITLMPTFICRNSGAADAVGPRYEWPFQARNHGWLPDTDNPTGPYLHSYFNPDGFSGGTILGVDTVYLMLGPMPIMGAAYSTTNVTETTATKYILGSKASGPAASKMWVMRAEQDIAAGTNVSGVTKPGHTDSAETGPQLDAGIITLGLGLNVTLHNVSYLGAIAFASTGDSVDGLGVNVIACPQALLDPNTGETLSGGRTEGTHRPYPSIGTITTLTFHDASLAGGQPTTNIRTVTAPFSFRVLKVTYGCSGSGAGGSLRLNNITQNHNICTALGVEAAGSYEVEPGDAQFEMGNRDVAEGDTLGLWGVTSGSSLDNAYAVLTIQVTGLPFDDAEPWRRWKWQRSPGGTDNTTEAQGIQHANITNHHKYTGPAVGGFAALYIGTKDSSAAVANEPLQTIIAPFDMEVHAVGLGASIGGAGGQMKVVNTTAGTDVCAYQAYTDTNANNQGVTAFLSTPVTVERGDVLTVTTTTTGVALTDAQAILFGKVTGFPYASEALD